jgi:RNA polymerase sigma factor (sigma-70 family)
VTPPAVLAGLAALEPLEREALILLYFQQRTQAQIAESLSVERATVARAVSRALQRLAAFLAEMPESESLSEGFAS